jgi:putative transposase
VVSAFRTRRLDHTPFPYVYLDATYLHVRNDASQVVSMAVVVASGVRADGRETLGLDVGDSEDEVFWRSFLSSLKKRGLGGVQLVISDQHAGLAAALKRSFQGTAHQRCRVHFARNLLAHVPKAQADYVPRRSARSSPSPAQPRCTRRGTKPATSSPRGSPSSEP